jgi:hypothetical protein
MEIRELFDTGKDICRTIEKVITYGIDQEERLKREISEYVVTEHIDEQFQRLLEKMQLAMERGGEYEVGVWVSGFYGSGKSSFTKYLGFALDDEVEIEGVAFRKHLRDRLRTPQAKAILDSTAQRYPAAIVMLDLASEMVAGATMEDVATVLYYKVLQWAGYSRNLKVAALERKLQQDGRYDEWLQLVKEETGVPWKQVQDDPLVIDSAVPELAHRVYPQIFRTESSFDAEASEYVRFENERVAEMIDIVRQKSGHEHIIFIIDEVGQYIGSRSNLILNLDGLAKNLRSIGDGKVWIIGTAQQTLTEDDPNAALNSPELYKLKDRFPIEVNLQSRDIKEITIERLLDKSAAGANKLGQLFDQHGQQLRHNIKLEDAPAYESELDQKTFTDLYPFLPAHFDILLQMLAVLAKSTGGIGLRSAIKVIQDILIEGTHGMPAATQEVGWLANAVTIYDTLSADIETAFPGVYRAVEKVTAIRFPDKPVHQAVAKTVGLLQVLDNMPVTRQNVAGLLQPSVSAPSLRDAVDAAVDDLLADTIVPFGESDGNLTFFSEKLNDINVERADIPLRGIELRRIRNEALRALFQPLPSVRLSNQLVVTAGLKATDGIQVDNLAGDNQAVQMMVQLAPPTDMDSVRQTVVDNSRQPLNDKLIYLIGRIDPAMNDLLGEIYRSREISKRYRDDPDQEVRDYVTAQQDRAEAQLGEVQHILKRQLFAGSFIFRGQVTAANALATDLQTAAKQLLRSAGERVYDHYDEAPVRVNTGVAEDFLRTPNLNAMTSAKDPLDLVIVTGGQPRIDIDHPALTSIRDRLEREGTVDGRRLTDLFTEAPYGWSPDTLRYLVAALLVASEIKLRVGGREITTAGQHAIESLRTNNAFKKVGVGLRSTKPAQEVLARASRRLTELRGETVIPLEKAIGEAARDLGPKLKHRYGGLAERLRRLGVAGAQDAAALDDALADLMATDASDAPRQFGAEQSVLYERLRWAQAVTQALDGGLDKTIRRLQQIRTRLENLPADGSAGELRDLLQDDLAWLEERLGQKTFYEYTADFNTHLTTMEASIRAATQKMAEEQQEAVRSAQETLQQTPGWGEINSDSRSRMLGQLEEIVQPAGDGIDGIYTILNQTYTLRERGAKLWERIEEETRERLKNKLEIELEEKGDRDGKKIIQRTLPVPQKPTRQQIVDLLRQLQELRTELELYDDIDITIELQA